MSQLALPLGFRDFWRGLVETHIRTGIATVTLKEFAFTVDSSPSNISDALAERDRKRLAGEHLIALLDMQPRELTIATLKTLAARYGCRVEPEPMSPEQENRITREYLATNAPGLMSGLNKALGRVP